MNAQQKTLLQVAHLGDPVLRKKATIVENIRDEKIQQLIDNLIATVLDVNGVGIAAPQVYISQRIFIVASHPNPRYPNAPHMKPTAIMNPKILSMSDEKIKDWEGCLSIPGIRGRVPRARTIHVSYTDRYGNIKERKFSDFIARIFQHEYDHIEGIMFLDRIESTRDFISEKEYQKIIQKSLKKTVKKNLKK